MVLNAAAVRVVPDADWWVGDGEPVAELSADDGRAFTAGELLFKTHNAFVAGLRQTNHQLFEGFTLATEPAAGGRPLYVLELGS